MNKNISVLIDKMIHSFENSVTNDREYAEQLKKEYKKYLEYSVEHLTSPDSSYPINDDGLLEEILTELAQDLIDRPIEYKKQFLLEDKSMDKIQRISNRIYQAAVYAKKGKIRGRKIKNIKEIEEQLNDLLQEVKPWNREQAERLVSETVIELGILQNPNTDILSLRLGHIYGNKKINEEEER